MSRRRNKPNEKWLTDVTEFKYNVGDEVRKVYLSAIFDLCDKKIVSHMIGDSKFPPCCAAGRKLTKLSFVFLYCLLDKERSKPGRAEFL